MKETISESIQSIGSKEEAFRWISKVIQTHFPLAIWQLPNSDQIQVLVDITSKEEHHSSDIECSDNCFYLNPFAVNHPINPMVLSGDILIKIQNQSVETTLSSTLSGNEIEEFENVLADEQINRKKLEKTSINPQPDYEQMVSEAVDKIKDGAISKVVLSRYKDFDLPEDFNVLTFFEQLTNKYTNAFCYYLQTQTYGSWMGATPEKLIAVENDQFFSTDALAGTQVLADDQDLSDIAWRQKEIEEQAMVSRYIINCFKKIRLREFEEIGPRTAKAGALVHLKTTFKVDMRATNSPKLGSTMLELLHPTSAVCGYPLDLAKAFINSHEDYQRELYAGFLGPVGIDGDTRLFVNLRCMQLFQKKARLYAGAGITQDSNPEKELIETENKMKTLLNVLMQ